MEGFAQMVQDELTATVPPRNVVLRDFGDSALQWGAILLGFVIGLLFLYFGTECLAEYLAPENGVSVTAQVTGHSISHGKGGTHYYLQVAFQDQQDERKVSQIWVRQQEFNAYSNDSSIAIKYMPGFILWPVLSQYGSNSDTIYAVILLFVLALVGFLVPGLVITKDFKFFKNGVFIKGTVTNVQDEGDPRRGRRTWEKIKVEYLLNGVKNETLVTRPGSDATLNNEAAVVVIPGEPEKIRVFFSNDNPSVFQVKVPDSFYKQ
jgi:hypothetical protein